MKVLGLTCLLLVTSGPLLADRAHDLAKVAAKQKPARCVPADLNTQTCHQQFPTGCTDAKTLAYDPYLNFLKDQTPGAALPSTAVLGQTDFQSLEGKIPPGLSTGRHAQFASQLAPLGEGNIVTVFAYLYFVEDTGKGANGKPSVGETCNCKLQLPDSYDFHVGLGFDKTLAAQIRQKKTQPVLGQPTAMEKTSVVAEMTPHTRGPKWTFARVNSLQGQQVKVVGQLMVDNAHLNGKDDCGFSGAAATCWRSTVWEIHPVTQFYVCNLSGGCNASSPDSAWTNLDNMP
ncbi:MAG TPA: hypothetical protein VE263_07020 [Candidatus Angelobacter sp.]|nr:hypothetical protein [Candidatus Angelobacter sp.]